MRLLVVGATGLLGRRIVAAAAAQDGIEVVAYVRSPAKLEAALPPSVHASIEVVQGNGEDTAALKAVCTEHRIDALVASVKAPNGQPEVRPRANAVLTMTVRDRGLSRGRRWGDRGRQDARSTDPRLVHQRLSGARRPDSTWPDHPGSARHLSSPVCV